MKHFKNRGRKNELRLYPSRLLQYSYVAFCTFVQMNPYLEKVAKAQSSLIMDEAKIMENRLKLVGMCDHINAEVINAWLTRVSAVPRKPAAAKPKKAPK